MPPPSINKVIPEDWPATARYPNPPKFVETPEVDIIYFNTWADSNFQTLRTGSKGPVEDALVVLTRNIEKGCFKRVVSVSASKHSLVVVVSTKLSHDELMKKGFAVSAGWKGQKKESEIEGTQKGSVGKEEIAEGGQE